MDIDVRDLELLEAVHQHQTLTAAANKLYVSQPALSQRLLKLEQRLGADLFERQGRRLVATTAGRRMLQAARVALHEVRDAVRDVTEMSSGEREVVRLWSQCSTNFQWLPEVMRSFRQAQPAADVAIETMHDGEHIDALVERRLDVALVTKLDQQTGRVRLNRLFDDELVAVVRHDHPWVGRPYVGAEGFAEAHLVLFDSYDPARQPPVPLPVPPGFVPGRLTTLPLVPDLLIEMVADSDMVTVMPSWVTAPYLAGGQVTTVQVGAVPQARTWYAATRHETTPPHIDGFLDALSASLARGEHERRPALA